MLQSITAQFRKAWANSAGVILYLWRLYSCHLFSPIRPLLNWYTVLPIMWEPPGPFSLIHCGFSQATDSGSVLYIGLVSPCSWRTSIRWDIKSEGLWSQLLWEGPVSVTTQHQLGNITFTHRASGSKHNEESRGRDFSFLLLQMRIFTITTCVFFLLDCFTMAA